VRRWCLSRCDRPPAFSGRKGCAWPCGSMPRLNGAGLSQRDRRYPDSPVIPVPNHRIGKPHPLLITPGRPPDHTFTHRYLGVRVVSLMDAHSSPLEHMDTASRRPFLPWSPRANPGPCSPKTEVGRDAALRRPRAPAARNETPQDRGSCTVSSARSARAGTAQRAAPTPFDHGSTSEFGFSSTTNGPSAAEPPST